MKQITIIGNLGSNATLRTTADGRQIMTFSVAVSKKDTTPTWFNCIARHREGLFAYLLKGQCVVVTGELNVGTYKGEPDLTVNADYIELCGKAPEAEPETKTEGDNEHSQVV